MAQIIPDFVSYIYFVYKEDFCSYIRCIFWASETLLDIAPCFLEMDKILYLQNKLIYSLKQSELQLGEDHRNLYEL